MSLTLDNRPDASSAAMLDMVCSGGGSRAILGSSGMILACHAMGVDRWRTAGGVSGGSIPSAMAAAGVPAPEIVRKVIETEFSSLLTQRRNLLRIWWAFFLKECAWRRRSTDAVLGSEKIGEFVERFVSRWPDNYWTVAVDGDRPLLFTAQGVYELTADGKAVQISSKPAPLGMAIRASCAVPGIIEAVSYNGSYLLDGALTPFGKCPVGVAKRFLSAAPGGIIASDVSEDSPESDRKESIFFRLLRRIVCGPCCDPNPDPPVDSEGVILVRPLMPEVQSLQFTYTSDQKWQAVMAGFTAAVFALSGTGRVADDRLARARQIVASYDEIVRTAAGENELTARVEKLLAAEGLY